MLIPYGKSSACCTGIILAGSNSLVCRVPYCCRWSSPLLWCLLLDSFVPPSASSSLSLSLSFDFFFPGRPARKPTLLRCIAIIIIIIIIVIVITIVNIIIIIAVIIVFIMIINMIIIIIIAISFSNLFLATTSTGQSLE